MPTRSNWKKAAYPHVVKDANITAKNATIAGLESTDIRVSNIEGTGYLESKKDIVESTGDNYSSSEYAGLSISAEAIRYTGGVQLPDLTVDGNTLQQYIQPITLLNSFDGTEEIHGVVGYAAQRESSNLDSSANISAFGLFGAPGENVVLTVSEQQGSMYNYLKSSEQSDIATVKTGIIVDASNRVFMGVNGNELYPGGLDLLVKGSENAQLYVKGDIIVDGSGVQLEKYIVDDMFIGSSAAIMGNQLSDDGMNSNDINLSVPNLEKYLEDYEIANGNQGYLFVANTTKLFADLNVSGGVTIGSGNNLDNSGYWASGIETLKINTPFIKDASQVYSGFDSSIYKDGIESDDNLVSRIRHEVYDGKDSSLLIQHSNKDEDGDSSQGSLIFLKTNEGAETVTGDVLGAIQFRGVYNSGTDNDPDYREFSTASIKSKQIDTSKNNLDISASDVSITLPTGGIITKSTYTTESDPSNSLVDLSFVIDYVSDNAKWIIDSSESSISEYSDYVSGEESTMSTAGNKIKTFDNGYAVLIDYNTSDGGCLYNPCSLQNAGLIVRPQQDNCNDGAIAIVGKRNSATESESTYASQILMGNKDNGAAGGSSGTWYLGAIRSSVTNHAYDNSSCNVGNIQFCGSQDGKELVSFIEYVGEENRIDITATSVDITASSDLTFDISSGEGTIKTQGADIDLGGGDISNVNIITSSKIIIDKPGETNRSFVMQNSATDDKFRIVFNSDSDKVYFQMENPVVDTSYHTMFILDNSNGDKEFLFNSRVNVNSCDISGVKNIISKHDKINFDVNGGEGTINTQGADIDLSGGSIKNFILDLDNEGEINTNGADIDLSGGNIIDVNDISDVNNIIASGDLTFNVNSGNGTIFTNGANIDLSGGSIKNAVYELGDEDTFNTNGADIDLSGGDIIDVNEINCGKCIIDKPGETNRYFVMKDSTTDDRFQIVFNSDTGEVFFQMKESGNETESIFLLDNINKEFVFTSQVNVNNYDISGVTNIIAPGDLTFDISNAEGTIKTQGATIDLGGGTIINGNFDLNVQDTFDTNGVDIDLGGGDIINVNDISGVNYITSTGDLTFDISDGEGTIKTQGANIDLGGGDISNVKSITSGNIIIDEPGQTNRSFIMKNSATDDKFRIVFNSDSDKVYFQIENPVVDTSYHSMFILDNSNGDKEVLFNSRVNLYSHDISGVKNIYANGKNINFDVNGGEGTIYTQGADIDLSGGSIKNFILDLDTQDEINTNGADIDLSGGNIIDVNNISGINNIIASGDLTFDISSGEGTIKTQGADIDLGGGSIKNAVYELSDEDTFNTSGADIDLSGGNIINVNDISGINNITSTGDLTFDISNAEGTIKTQGATIDLGGGTIINGNFDLNLQDTFDTSGADIDLGGGDIINVNDISGVNNIIASGDLSFNVNGGNGTIYTQGADIDLSGGNIIDVNNISGINNIIASGDLTFDISSGEGTIKTQGADIDLGGGSIKNAVYELSDEDTFNTSGADIDLSGGNIIDVNNISGINNIIASGDLTFDISSGEGTIKTQGADIDLGGGSIKNAVYELSDEDTFNTSGADIDLGGGDIINVNDISGVNYITSSGDLSFNVNGGNGTIYTQGADINLGGGSIQGFTLDFNTSGEINTRGADINLSGGDIIDVNDISGINNITSTGDLTFDISNAEGTIKTQGATIDLGGGTIINGNFDLNLQDTFDTSGADIDLGGGDIIDVNDISGINNIIASGDLSFNVNNGNGTIYTQGADIDLSGGSIINAVYKLGNEDTFDTDGADIDLGGGNIIDVNDILGINNIIASGDLSFNVDSGNGTIYTQGADIDLGGGTIKHAYYQDISTNGTDINLGGGNIIDVNDITATEDLSFNLNDGNGTIFTNGADINLGGGSIKNAVYELSNEDTFDTSGADIDLGGGDIINVNDILGINNIIASGDLSFNVDSGNGTIYTQGADIDLGDGDISNVNYISGVNNITATEDLSFNLNDGNGTIFTNGADIDLGDGDISNVTSITTEELYIGGPGKNDINLEMKRSELEAKFRIKLSTDDVDVDSVYFQMTKVYDDTTVTEYQDMFTLTTKNLLGPKDNVFQLNSHLDVNNKIINNVTDISASDDLKLVSNGDFLFDVNRQAGTIKTQGADIDLSGGDIDLSGGDIDLGGGTIKHAYYQDISTNGTDINLGGGNIIDVNDISSTGDLNFNVNDGNGTIYTNGADIDLGDGDISNVFLITTEELIIDRPGQENINFFMKNSDKDREFKIQYETNSENTVNFKLYDTDAGDFVNFYSLQIDQSERALFTFGDCTYIDVNERDISNVNNIYTPTENLNFHLNPDNNGDSTGFIKTHGGGINLDGGDIIDASNISGVNSISSTGDLSFNVNDGDGTIFTNGADIDLSGGGTIKNVTEITSGDGNNLTFDISNGQGTIYTNGATIDLSGDDTDGGNIVNIKELKSAGLPEQSISKILMVQTATKGIFRMDASANWEDGIDNTSNNTSNLTDDGRHRLNGTKSGKTMLDELDRDLDDEVNKYGNGRIIIDYDVDDGTENNNKHFWKFGFGSSSWITFDNADEDGKFYIQEAGFYRISSNIRAINVTTASSGSVDYIDHNISLGFYISRAVSTKDDDDAHEYWDNGICGSFGLIYLNGESHGRCGSTSFSNIYEVTESEIEANKNFFCVRTQYSDGAGSDNTHGFYVSDIDNRHGNSGRLWGTTRPCDDFQTWVQLIFEKIN